MWSSRVFAPAKLREIVLEMLQEGYIGMIKMMKGFSQGFVWWPNIDKHSPDSCKHHIHALDNCKQHIHSPDSYRQHIHSQSFIYFVNDVTTILIRFLHVGSNKCIVLMNH